MNDIQRFLSKTRKEGKCIIRTSPTGAFSLGGKGYNPRTAVWMLYKGRAPSGKLTTTCGTKFCVNIAHLEDTVKAYGQKNRHVHYEVRLPNKLITVAITPERARTLPSLRSVCCRECGGPLYYTFCVVEFCPRSWVRRSHGNEENPVSQNVLS